MRVLHINRRYHDHSSDAIFTRCRYGWYGNVSFAAQAIVCRCSGYRHEVSELGHGFAYADKCPQSAAGFADAAKGEPY